MLRRMRANWRSRAGVWKETPFRSGRDGVSFAVVMDLGGPRDAIVGLFEKRADAEAFAESHPQYRLAEVSDAQE